MGLLYLWPRGTTVSEEILYNVIVGEGHLCPGSLLHALVSSRKRCHLSFRKYFTQNSSIGWRDYFFKKSSRNNQNDFLKNTWIQHMWRKIPTDRKTQQSALWIRARVNLCVGKLLAYIHTCKHPGFLSIILLASPGNIGWNRILQNTLRISKRPTLDAQLCRRSALLRVADFQTRGTACPAKHPRSGFIPDYCCIIRAGKQTSFMIYTNSIMNT